MTQQKRSTNPDFSARHYRKVAGVIFAHRQQFEGGRNPNKVAAGEELARSFADVFGADNANFDRARFIEACTTGKGADNG